MKQHSTYELGENTKVSRIFNVCCILKNTEDSAQYQLMSDKLKTIGDNVHVVYGNNLNTGIQNIGDSLRSTSVTNVIIYFGTMTSEEKEDRKQKDDMSGSPIPIIELGDIKTADEALNKLSEYKNNPINHKKVLKLMRLLGLKCKSSNVSRYNSYKGQVGKTVKNLLLNKVVDKEKYNIAIAHNPLMAYAYESFGFDLVFSGHVHGGLVKLPLLGGILSPEYKLFPKYYEGIYNLNKTKMIVSRGLGFCKRLPIRILNPAEVVIINLCNK